MFDSLKNTIFKQVEQGETVPCSNFLTIDYIKFMAIFLVVFAHYLNLMYFPYSEDSDLFRQYIHMFHIPMFFIIAGFLYKENRTKKENLIKIIYGLVIPYLLYQFMYIPVKSLGLMHWNGYSFPELLKYILPSIICPDTYEHHNIIPLCVPCWFIMVMIQLRLLLCFVKTTLKNLIILCVSCIAIIKSLAFMRIDLVCCVDATIFAAPYLALGLIIKKYVNFEFFSKISRYGILLVPILAFLIWEIFLVNGYVPISFVLFDGLVLKKSILLTYLASALGTLMIAILASYFKKSNDFIDTISKNTLFILFFHWVVHFFLLYGKVYQFVQYLEPPIWQFIFVFVISLLLLVISYLVIKKLEKYCLILLGKYRLPVKK